MFQKVRGNLLAPVDPAAEKFLAGLKLGDGANVEVTKGRNVRFHRKFFALLQLAFDVWDPPADRTYKGEPIGKEFESFREDILILAGHCEAHFGIGGAVRLKAKSISFAKCDEYDFNDVYGSVLKVVWDKILRHAKFASEQEVEQVVNQLLAFE
ncbi:DUF1367 family protein [Burkholderia sp. Ac-20349]|uniref:DUF1367 family protein n=1 Tax=Burkholderia sp. Ac-20349 TaxID=2703893 RepID=UPI00197C3541|nr:DUF1367 family protein [Burkholderia sp. Ac-20349]MBN3839236.1 DUF1367 family protein [Burkholderia sp. Ac-20349]